MKWIRWWGLVVFFGLMVISAAAWYLMAPWLVKSAIESVGSEAVGAKVEVSNIELGLYPAKFNLKSLQIANPDAPMTNSLEVDEISLVIDSGPIFWKKLVVEEMIISGVKLSTPRTSSGALEGGRKSQQALDSVANFELPDIKQIDTDKLVQDADLLTPKRIEEFNKTSAEIQKYWEDALDQKVFDDALLSINTDFNKLKIRAKENKLNLLKDRKKWKALKKTIKQQQNQFSELKNKLNADKENLNKQFKLVKRGPADDLDRLMSQVGMGEGGLENLSEKLMGPRISPWVLKALKLAKGYQSKAGTDVDDEDEKRQGLGRRVYFKDEQIWPEILVKNIVLSGAQESWKLSGEGNDIAVPPWQWKKPANLSAEFDGSGNASFNLKSAWKSETEMLTEVSAIANNWTLKNYILKQDEVGKYELLSTVINSNLSGEITLENVNLKLDISLASPRISFPENIQGWQKQIMEGINQQKSIDISVVVSGKLTAPKIKIKSGLEKIFQQMLKQRMSKETDKIKQALQDSLSEKIGDISNLQNMDFSAFQNQINLGDNQLGDLLGKF